MTGLTADRRSGGAASEKLGEKKPVVRERGIPSVPCLRNPKKNEGKRVAEGELREHETD